MNRVVGRRQLAISALLPAGLLRSRHIDLGRPPVQLFGLVDVPSVDGNPQAGVYRIVMAPGESWSQEYPGPVAMTVESGSMSVPDFLTRHLIGAGRGGDSNCPDPLPHGPIFGCATGFIAETGSYGTITNVGEDDLSILVLFTSPPENVR
jgi:hypothetical protein